MISAFGVDHGDEVSKTLGDYVAGPMLAAKPGHKKKAMLNQAKHSAIGTTAGATAGAAIGAGLGALSHRPGAVAGGATLGAGVGAGLGYTGGRVSGYKSNKKAGHFRSNDSVEKGFGGVGEAFNAGLKGAAKRPMPGPMKPSAVGNLANKAGKATGGLKALPKPAKAGIGAGAGVGAFGVAHHMGANSQRKQF